MARVQATRAAAAGMAVMVWASAPVTILAQTGVEAQKKELLAPPPPIEFGPWRQLDADELSKTYEVNFASAVVTRYPENNTVRLKVMIPADALGASPVAVLLHYWGATDLNLETDMGRELNALGTSAVIVTLPYHLSRTPHGTRSGELALQPNTAELFSTMDQSVKDVRRAVDWIQSRQEFDSAKIGLGGTSLGGIVGALAFGIEKRFTCGGFVLAGGNLAKILWTSSKVVSQREAFRRRGYTEDRLRAELQAIEPLTYLTGETRPSLVIAARQDTVVVPQCSQALAEALKTESVVWLDTGHYGGAFARSRIVRTVARFFSNAFQGSAYRPPPSIRSLTLKFGLVYSAERNLQVAASTDLWRLDKAGSLFGSVMVTPQGFQGFLGHTVSKGLSFGVVLLPRRSGPGVTWNIAF